MPPIMTVDELRGWVSTGLGDDKLELLINGLDEMIIAHAGPLGDIVDVRWPRGERFILLGRRPTSKADVEIVEQLANQAPVTLDAEDFDLNVLTLRRSIYGPNARDYWDEKVTITYTAADDLNQRRLVLVQLATAFLELGLHPGRVGFTVGAHSEQWANSANAQEGKAWVTASQAILSTLEVGAVPSFA
jgi:hypothetical protein